MRDTLEARIWESIERKGADECWLWLKAGRRVGEKRYPCIYSHTDKNGRKEVIDPRRFLYKKSIPGYMCILPSCGNNMCCNPKHIKIVTRKNMIKELAKKRSFHKNSDCPLLKYREENNLSIEELSKKTGVSYHIIRQFENGKSIPESVATLKKIENATGLKLIEDIPCDNSMGERLRIARRKAGYTLAEFAKKLDVTRQLVHQWERYGTRIAEYHIDEIIKLTDLKREDLFRKQMNATKNDVDFSDRYKKKWIEDENKLCITCPFCSGKGNVAINTKTGEVIE